MFKMIKLTVDFQTGERPIPVKGNKNLPCNPTWQDTDAGFEFRRVIDGKTDAFIGVPGIEIFDGFDVCIAALKAGIPDLVYYKLANEPLMNANLAKLVAGDTINLDILPNTATQQEELAFLYDAGVSGIEKKTRTIYIPKQK